MTEAIIVALITAGFPLLATVISTLWQNRIFGRHSAKQSILQMIMEDEFSYEQFGKLPVNHTAILEEFEHYTKSGGNGETHKKVEEYESWFNEIEKRNSERKKKCTKSSK